MTEHQYKTAREALEAHMRGEITLDEAAAVADRRTMEILAEVRAKHRNETPAPPAKQP